MTTSQLPNKLKTGAHIGAGSIISIVKKCNTNYNKKAIFKIVYTLYIQESKTTERVYGLHAA